ncbi:MAG TPA: ferritin-like domain-containing protein, partial [Fontimonas sp.]
MSEDWRAAAFAALTQTDPERKCAGILGLRVEGPAPSAQAFDWSRVPGRPPRPELVHPRDVPHRALGTPLGRCALIHAVAHIEFNAMNLALDAVCRFDGLPPAFYADWVSVAQDEARHFTLLRARLLELGSDYGEFTAHNGLWEAAEKTAHDVLVRMALVPRVLEARGLDVSPGIIERLRGVGDGQTQAILELILAEEVRHVALG